MSRATRIVVGVDGSANASAALRWALLESRTWRAALDVIHAWETPHIVSPTGVPGPASDLAPFEEQAKLLLEDAIASVPVDTVGLTDVNPIVVHGRAADALVDASSRAHLLVVGSRGHGALRGLLGSVSHRCVHHTSVPVAVIPPSWDASQHAARITVGVDGSEGSSRALQWGMEEAAQRLVELQVVHSWTTPYPVEPWGTVITPRDQRTFDEQARELMDAMVERARLLGAHEPRSITFAAVHDASGPALVDTSEDSDLLVVGSRGRGGFAALVLGSTSLYCLHHATRPVVIVPTEP